MFGVFKNLRQWVNYETATSGWGIGFLLFVWGFIGITGNYVNWGFGHFKVSTYRGVTRDRVAILFGYAFGPTARVTMTWGYCVRCGRLLDRSCVVGEACYRLFVSVFLRSGDLTSSLR